MAEKDPTLKGTLEDDTPKSTPEKTAKEKETPQEPEKEPEKTPEEPVDYKFKYDELGERYRAQREEAIRLKKELEKTQKNEPKAETPETVESDEGETLDEIVDRKLQEKIAPLTKEQEKKAVDGFFKNNPDAMDYLEQIEVAYPKMPGETISAKMENAFLVAKKDAMRDAGKKEMAFSLYQKEQAVASGGGASSSKAEGSLPSLNEEERQVATAMGITEEAYAKRKLESTKRK